MMTLNEAKQYLIEKGYTVTNLEDENIFVRYDTNNGILILAGCGIEADHNIIRYVFKKLRPKVKYMTVESGKNGGEVSFDEDAKIRENQYYIWVIWKTEIEKQQIIDMVKKWIISYLKNPVDLRPPFSNGDDIYDTYES